MAQTLKFGNGTWATKKGSTLSYNDEGGNYKPLPFTTTRNSIGTRVNKEGLIEVVGNDVPRIDYTDSAEGVLLLEPSRTNRITQSNQFDSTWISIDVALTSNQDGLGASTDALKITSTNGNGYLRFNASGWSGENTFSVYAKSGTLNSIYMTGFGNTFFNLETGTVGTSAASEASIKSMGNGWYRCSVTGNTDPSQVRIYPSNLENTNTTGSVYIQYSQVELGSYATSYIPTYGSTVQRAADTASGAGNSEVFNDSEGVLFADIAALANDSSLRTITLGDNSSSNAVSFRYDNPNQITLYLNSGGVSQFSAAANVQTLSFNKCLIKYKANDFSAWVNGFKIGVDTSGIIFPSGTLDRLNFDIGYNSVSPFHGKTKEIGYYDTALTDAELEYMTSYRSLNELVTELNLNTL